MRRTPLTVGLATLGGIALAAGPLAGPAAAAPTEIQILTINDFHGRLVADGNAAVPGAALLAGAVSELSADVPGATAFVSAGDSIGASPFVSAVQDDAPTLDVLDQMGLDASAVGNHEFDRGYDFLSDPATHGIDGTGLATWPSLGANVEGESPDLPASAVIDVAGVAVGFVGVVTQQTSSLVAADGIAGITFTNPVEAANAEADRLVDEGDADVVVLLAHEGAAAPSQDEASCAAIASSGDAFGSIVTDANENIDAIVGGHTHLAVDCEFPTPSTEDDDALTRPVIEASSYGRTVGRLTLTVDPDTDVVSAAAGDLVDVLDEEGESTFTPDPAVEATVAAAVAAADEVGSVEVGRIEADISRAVAADGETEDRGAESALGNFIADVQLDATSTPELGGAQIALMNPGGLRADFAVAPSGEEGEGVVTYSEAAEVQPFANGLVTMTLTGAQVRQVLEEQWQPNNDDGTAPTRPFLALGLSGGFAYTYTVDAARGSHVVDVTLDGVALDATASYRVTVNSFLATGGDNFDTLALGTDRQDNGFNDLNVLVDYLAANSPVTAAQIADLTPRRAVAVPAAPTPPGPSPTAPGAGGPGTGGSQGGQNRGLSVDTGVTGAAGAPAGQGWAVGGLLLALSVGGVAASRRRGAVR